MIKYTTYGKFQSEMNSYYKRTGMKMQFPEMIARMDEKGLMDQSPSYVRIPLDSLSMDDEEFDKLVDSIPLHIGATYNGSNEIGEDKMIPSLFDVFTIRHPRLTRHSSHTHNYFELNFVVKGSANFYFEETCRKMNEGEVSIIAPGSTHDLVIEDETSIVYTVCIRRSTFESTFSSLMYQQDLLSGFFRTMLKDEKHSNYLMLFTENNMECRIFLRKLLIETENQDSYSNNCCINLINLFFSNLLRNYSKTISFYNYDINSDFSLVLQYIQHNYQNLTLSSLAEFFHYSEPHLCTLIKQNTGKNYTDLIKSLRMKNAKDLLMNTTQKINEIAEEIGYNSADHFSRVFRGEFGMSPAEFRKQNKIDGPFIPFSTEN
ncbi:MULTISPECIES: AraC family transcriptional regulator [unclassified Butyrivibrio]|uniref:AraC family transcriptional regulator n=1 Tax=unclassified Butyrivibrio TaxID=2639466 RepID=UPI000421A00F|nr:MULTISPECIES: AraC family transcriptional regulator [unclassified Butyrivibrio]